MSNDSNPYNRAKVASDGNGKLWLKEAFKSVQRVLETQLNASTGTITHSGILGAVNENHWIDVFKSYLPARYAVDPGIVIDSDGKTSKQIDIVIYDRHFTPVLLSQQQHRYIPAEAVYAIIEAKPEINKDNLTDASEKAASVRALKRTSIEITHAGGTFPAKKLFPIAAGIIAAKAGWTDGLGVPFKDNWGKLTGEQFINFGCALEHGAFDTFDSDSPAVVPPEGALVYFLFRLLRHLQTLATVPAIDWTAYANVIIAS